MNTEPSKYQVATGSLVSDRAVIVIVGKDSSFPITNGKLIHEERGCGLREDKAVFVAPFQSINAKHDNLVSNELK